MSLDAHDAAPLMESHGEVSLVPPMEPAPAEDSAVVEIDAEEPPSACEEPRAEDVEMDCDTDLA